MNCELLPFYYKVPQYSIPISNWDDKMDMPPHIDVTHDQSWDPQCSTLNYAWWLVDWTNPAILWPTMSSNRCSPILSSTIIIMFKTDCVVAYLIDGNTKQLLMVCVIKCKGKLALKTRHSKFMPEHITSLFNSTSWDGKEGHPSLYYTTTLSWSSTYITFTYPEIGLSWTMWKQNINGSIVMVYLTPLASTYTCTNDGNYT